MITINDNSVPQINAALLRLESSITQGMRAQVRNIDADFSSDINTLKRKISELAVKSVYKPGDHIDISSNSVISVIDVDKTLTIKRNGTTLGTFTALATEDKEVDIEVPDQVQSDWTETDTDSPAYIKNKPSMPSAQIQSDWAQTNTSSVDYIKNKPTELSDFTNNLPGTNNVFWVTEASGESGTKDAISLSGVPISNGDTSYSDKSILVMMQNRRANEEAYDAARYIKFNNGYSFRIWTNGTGADFQGGTTMKASMSLPYQLYIGGISEDRFHIRPAFNYAYNNEPASVGDSSRYRMFYAPFPATNGNTYGGRPYQMPLLIQYGSTSTTGTVWGFWMGNAYTEYVVYLNGVPISSLNYNIPAGEYLATFHDGKVFVYTTPSATRYENSGNGYAPAIEGNTWTAANSTNIPLIDGMVYVIEIWGAWGSNTYTGTLIHRYTPSYGWGFPIDILYMGNRYVLFSHWGWTNPSTNRRELIFYDNSTGWFASHSIAYRVYIKDW